MLRKRIFRHWLILSLLYIIFCNSSIAQIDFIEHVIVDNLFGMEAVFASDVDGDGDIDILGASSGENTDGVYVWENDSNFVWDQHQLNDDYFPAHDVLAADIDGDGDLDVVAAGSEADDDQYDYISWWRNNGNFNFTEFIIAEYKAGSISAADIDNDDDIDILSGPFAGFDDIEWWENDGDGNFTAHRITYDDEVAHGVHATDLDGDDDIDLLAAIMNFNHLRWWENDGDEVFTRHTISDHFNDAQDVYAADIDNDGDMDVLGAAAYRADIISVWENDGEQGFNDFLVGTLFRGAVDVHAADLDWDGDMEVLGVATDDDEITWWENNGDEDFTEHNLSSDFDGASSVFTADIDNDLAVDIIGAASNLGRVTWWENTLSPSPPDSFSLALPEDSAFFEEPPITFVWYSSNDPDPQDTVHYDLWLDTIPDFSTATLLADSISDTSYTSTTFNTDGFFYWTVRATDPMTSGTWANDTLSFSYLNPDVPDPPSAFSLISPLYGDTIEFDNPTVVEFSWAESVDPDSGENVLYNLRIILTLPDNRVRFLSYTELDTEALVVNIPDSLMVTQTIDYTEVSWRVLAMSGADMVQCDSSFIFSIAPFVAVDESQKNVSPEEFSISSVYPNPFNPSMNINISLPFSANLKVSIFNLLGQEISVLADGYHKAGNLKLTFDGANHPSGIFFIHASVPGKMDKVKKIVLVR
ncbi:MAG: FG-GAP-like repeat-containing protein [Candidatus Electryonea clarkiae]|nr:FG-GAP-like repeat-containing protein [Candidatus Electryonea clarkiae]MDP8285272.1 FG-GAP-like repeat-containing protein [Candidatus Electryonea clarkiae]